MKCVMITGAANGIGRATAEAFARQGVHVALVDKSAAGFDVVKAIEADGGHAFFVQQDLTDASAMKMIFAEIEQRFDRLDYAVNNAAIPNQPAATLSVDDDEWQRVMDLNLKSVWQAMKHQVALMQSNKQSYHSIVNIGSIAGIHAVSNLGIYSTSKAAMHMLSRNVAKDNAADNIRVNVVAPGQIMTEEVRRLQQEDPDTYKKYTAHMAPMQRLGQPEEIANTVLWLCSEQASFITGSILHVDGGLSA